jgi:hypothetical protein
MRIPHLRRFGFGGAGLHKIYDSAQDITSEGW